MAYYAFLEPLARRASRVPPTLLVRAGPDHPELDATIERFAVEALRQNAPLDVMNYPAGHHAFDVLDDTERSRYIIAQTLAFIRLHTTVAP